jgi:hypothetical protein
LNTIQIVIFALILFILSIYFILLYNKIYSNILLFTFIGFLFLISLYSLYSHSTFIGFLILLIYISVISVIFSWFIFSYHNILVTYTVTKPWYINFFSVLANKNKWIKYALISIIIFGIGFSLLIILQLFAVKFLCLDQFIFLNFSTFEFLVSNNILVSNGLMFSMFPGNFYSSGYILIILVSLLFIISLVGLASLFNNSLEKC